MNQISNHPFKEISHRKKMTMTTSPPPTAVYDTTVELTETTGLSTLPPHIIESHVLTRLDGQALASAASCSATLRHLSTQNHLWTELCHSTWPSTTSTRVTHMISTFPGGGPRAFFSHAFAEAPQNPSQTSTVPPTELISAVDIHYKERLILSKHQETESSSDWFRCSPFRIDLLEPKDFVPTPIKHPKGDETCADIINGMALSWILIDPIERRAMNLSTQKPVTIQRHWLTGEVKIKFASILAAENGHVLCSAVVTCGGSDCGKMQVMEVSLEMEDMDGAHLNGKDSLVILHRALEGKKGSEGKLSYDDYLEMRRERKERKVKTEEALDMFCLGFGVSILVAFFLFVLCR